MAPEKDLWTKEDSHRPIADPYHSILLKLDARTAYPL